MNVGSAGIMTTGGAINISGGTIGILEGEDGSGWTTGQVLSVSGDLTFDTTTYAMAADGNSSSSTGKGGTITLTGGANLSEGTKLIVSGAGKLVLGEDFVFGLNKLFFRKCEVFISVIILSTCCSVFERERMGEERVLRLSVEENEFVMLDVK